MIAVILKGWPRLSETFIAREIEALEARGLTLDLWSLRHPTDTKRHATHGRVQAQVTYLPEYLHEEPRRLLKAWRQLHRTPGYRQARRLFASDLKRDRSRNRVRRFGQALILAAERRPETRLFYAHFIHTPGSVARYAAALTGLPYGISAHARDIWTTPDWDLASKIGEARFVTSCTADGRARLTETGPHATDPHLNRHGLDLARWPCPGRRPARDGSSADNPIGILSVGRMVEKKGFGTLLDALAALPAGIHWRFTHIGGGPLRERLQAKAAKLGLTGRMIFQGAQPEDVVRAAMQAADLFVLTPEIAADGDRDGLPNVLVEAQSQGLAVISTRVGGIGELIEDGLNGLLCTPGDANGIGASIADLAGDPARRLAMGEVGCARVLQEFDATPGADAIARLLTDAMAAGA